MPNITDSLKLRIAIAVGVFLLLILIILSVVFTLGKKSSNKTLPQPNQTEQTEDNASVDEAESTPTKPIATYPEVSVDTWSTPASLTKQTSSRIFRYPLQQNYDKAHFVQLANRIGGMHKIVEKGDTFLAQATIAGKVQSSLLINKKNGSFMYYSEKGIALPKAQSTSILPTIEQVGALLTRITNDPTLSITAKYKNKKTAGITYFEAHRDWEEVGAPIFNILGLLNIPQSVGLNYLSFSYVNSTFNKNPDIVSTSDKTDGYIRRSDFNTMTLGVDDKTGRITSIDSNIRLLKNTNPKAVKPISYAAAVKLLRENKYKDLYTLPIGEGDISFDKVYPDNAGHIKNVTITESTIVYLEDLPVAAQEELAPYYLFRGTGQLDSGYKVAIVASVAASSDTPPPHAKRQVITNVLGAKAYLAQQTADSDSDDTTADDSQQIGKIGIEPLPTVPPTPAPSSPIYTPPCRDDTVNNQRTVNGATVGTSSKNKIVFPPGLTQFEQNVLIEIQRRKDNPGTCPRDVSGISPTLFLYNRSAISATVSQGRQLTYAEPATQSVGTWNIVVNKNELTVDGSSYPYLYYEYLPITYTKQKEGWIVDKSNLSAFVDSIIRPQLRLTAFEADRAVFELNHAARSISGDTLYASLIPQSELSSKLPLTITPRPANVYRYHFRLSTPTTTDYKAKPPHLTPIQRDGFTALEIGAAPSN